MQVVFRYTYLIGRYILSGDTLGPIPPVFPPEPPASQITSLPEKPWDDELEVNDETSFGDDIPRKHAKM